MAAKPCNDGAYETRILRLEDGFSELKAAHAETSTKLNSLSNQVDASTSHITSKIESCMMPVNERLHDTDKEITALNKQISDHSKFIEVMHVAKRESDQRAATWRKIGSYILMAAGAVLTKELIVMIFKH